MLKIKFKKFKQNDLSVNLSVCCVRSQINENRNKNVTRLFIPIGLAASLHC